MSEVSAGRAQRRTQQQRRDETRAALLDATIECLVESGYARLTLAQVTERAGLSVGAHLHHFKTRTVLVAAAIERLADLRVDDVRTRTGGEIELTALLDVVWELHSGPLYHAALDLWVAARTDPELCELLVGVEQRIDHELAQVVRRLPARYSDRADVADLVKMAFATIRGLAMRDCLQPGRDRDREWKACREYVLAAFALPNGYSLTPK
ncbi:TetR/AcrR family transcriptional regulator [Nocardia sp. NPDC050712]|uniref:TetR/AcrR family transcriptional regulator n=1 Tax=Nocardia sp. NPDC050712 TaxID=3155518 RepID=UPI0033FFD65E